MKLARFFEHLALFLIVLVGVGLIYNATQLARAQGCQLTISQPVTNSVVRGSIPVSATTQTLSGITAPVSFMLSGGTVSNQLTIGQVSTPQAGGLSWSFPWNSTTTPDGSYQLRAMTQTSGGSCTSSPVAISIANQTTPSPTITKLNTIIVPALWSGSTNLTAPFRASTWYTDQGGINRDVTTQAQYFWSTTIGTITGNGVNSSYFSGPNAGNGQVKVRVYYGGQSADASSAVTVQPLATTQPPTGSNSGSGGGGTASGSGTGSGNGSPATVTKPLDGPIYACLVSIVGAGKAEAINTGITQPTAEEKLKLAGCFSPKSVIPARLAPVEPTKVAELGSVEDKKSLELKEIKTVSTKQDNGKYQKSLAIAGVAPADTDVYIYIFSEPLVLKARSDGKGNLNYTLTNPLKPGKHEAYLVIEKSPGSFARSDVFGVSIARAASTEDNPQGNSLQVSDVDNTVLIQYGLAALIMIGVSIRLLFMMRRSKRIKYEDRNLTSS